jgi:16S rRNA (cytidine1402-2'-O)-methyltransferase
LLSHFGIKTPQFALHDHNEEHVVEVLLADLVAGRSIALVSDAGTPLISDPGYRLVRAAHQHKIAVSPVPGVSAATAALSAAGLATNRYCFEGFLPAKKNARRARIDELRHENRTIVLYESVHRVADCLADLVSAFGAEHAAFVGRELTKLHEQCVHSTLGSLAAMIENGSIPTKGEFVIVVAGSDARRTSSLDVDRLLVELAGALPGNEAAKLVARATGEKRNALYKRLLELRGDAADES